MLSGQDPKYSLLPHSEAKVDLYRNYLSSYLSILGNVESVRRIQIFDLLCGEGIYANGGKGSPVVALETIRDLHFANKDICPTIEIWFNDIGESTVEIGAKKIDRVKSIAGQIDLPDQVRISYFSENFTDILPSAIRYASTDRSSKNLFFIDPYGYKEVRLELLRRILTNRNSEVLLFLPTSFMYRFTSATDKRDFALSDFLNALFPSGAADFSSVFDFIAKLRDQFREYFSDLGTYVDTFSLQRDASNIYCLFFFTQNLKGFHKMVEAKWRVDHRGGRGYDSNANMRLFSEEELTGYPAKLRTCLEQNPEVTNHDLFIFGLNNGFLPKHTRAVLKKWEKSGLLVIKSLDGKPARDCYLTSKNRRVSFSLTE